jgi:xanthine dehydrogenase accessory factor
MLSVLHETNSRLELGLPCVYCAVVETRGSTPQKAGATMLVYPDGSQHGTLGGGCVEAEVKQKSLAALIAGGNAEVLTFSLDDNYGWDDGLICGGRMTMLMAPLDSARQSANRAYYAKYQALVESGKGCTEAVVLKNQGPLPAGARYLFDSRGQLAALLGPSGAEAEGIAGQLTPLAERPGPSLKQGIAFLPTLPRVTLLIVGGGHVGKAVAELAATVDFEVAIVDDRESYASVSRFPLARERIVGEIGPTLAKLKESSIDRSTYCLIVTRGHAHDEEALFHLAECKAAYVGMIGSKRKIKLIFEDLIAKGITPESLARVHAPLGFDIGSQTVAEIAISILAELIACRNLGSTAVPVRKTIRPENLAS